jgi:hypothetical protein
MRIEKNQIKISGRLPDTDLLNNIKQGSRISAVIAEKIGQKHALLNIGGNLVRAEFLQGVPDSGNVFLILEKKSNSNLIFRLENTTQQEAVKSELLEFVIVNKNELNKNLIYDLKLYLKQGGTTLFALNNSILRLAENDEKKKNDKIISLLNKLLSKGLKYDNLMSIAFLLNKGNPAAIQQFYFILSQVIPGRHKDFFKLDNKISEQIMEFTGLIDKLLSKDEKYEIIKEILVTIENSQGKEVQYGEIIFFDDNEFKLCKFIYNKNNIIIFLNLSYLGNLEILIKDEGAQISSVFCCENDESISALKDNIDLLQSSLKLHGKKKFFASFYNNKKAIEKIIEIISSIDINYLIDAKA